MQALFRASAAKIPGESDATKPSSTQEQATSADAAREIIQVRER
jgi:hypothetical protein